MTDEEIREKIEEGKDSNNDISMFPILQICCEALNGEFEKIVDDSKAYREYHKLEEFITLVLDMIEKNNYKDMEVPFTKYVIELIRISENMDAILYILKPSKYLQEKDEDITQKPPKEINEVSADEMRQLYVALIKAANCFDGIDNNRLKHYAQYLVDEDFIRYGYIRFISPHYEVLESFHEFLVPFSNDKKMRYCEEMLQYINEKSHERFQKEIKKEILKQIASKRSN